MEKNVQKKQLKRSINKKLGIIIIFATIFSLIMGAPISYFQYFLLNSGVLDFLGDTVNAIIQTYFTIIINLIILISFVTWGVRRFVIKPVIKITDTIDQIQQDQIDLSQRIEHTSNDELGKLSFSFNQLNGKLHKVVQTFQFSTEEVAAVTEENAASVQGISQQVQSIQNRAKDLVKQAHDGDLTIEEVSQALLELSSLIQIAESKANSALQSSNETSKASKAGKEKVSLVIKRMESINIQTDRTKQELNKLNDYSKKITHMVDTITQIAENTNLLALNASIEAARAGESGKGFAVVASEVRKLAELSTKEAEHVAEIVSLITDTTKRAVKEMDMNKAEVEGGVLAVEEAGTALSHIGTAVQKTVTEMNEIKCVTSEEVATSEKIISLIDKLGSFIDTTDKSAREVSEFIDQISESIEQISQSTEEMSEMATKLTDETAIFKV